MADKTSFEERLARLSQNAPVERPRAAPKPVPPSVNHALLGARIIVPMVGLVMLASVIFIVTGDTKGADVRRGPFDLAGAIRSNMTEEEIEEMNTNPRINRAAAQAPNEGAADMVRLLLSH